MLLQECLPWVDFSGKFYSDLLYSIRRRHSIFVMFVERFLCPASSQEIPLKVYYQSRMDRSSDCDTLHIIDERTEHFARLGENGSVGSPVSRETTKKSERDWKELEDQYLDCGPVSGETFQGMLVLSSAVIPNKA